MGKTIFTDSEILMFARYEMSGVTLSSETPDFDEAPFKGPWDSASDGHDIPVASSEPPPAPISKDSSESRRSTRTSRRTSRPRLQFSFLLRRETRTNAFVPHGTKVEARPLKLPITLERSLPLAPMKSDRIPSMSQMPTPC